VLFPPRASYPLFLGLSPLQCHTVNFQLFPLFLASRPFFPRPPAVTHLVLPLASPPNAPLSIILNALPASGLQALSCPFGLIPMTIGLPPILLFGLTPGVFLTPDLAGLDTTYSCLTQLRASYPLYSIPFYHGVSRNP